LLNDAFLAKTSIRITSFIQIIEMKFILFDNIANRRPFKFFTFESAM